MKILAFADTHLSGPAIKRILKVTDDADVLVCAGDISWFGYGLKNILDLFEKELAKKKKHLYIIHGNHEDPPTAIEKVTRKLKWIHFMHTKTLLLDGYRFFFWGGGGFAEQDPLMEKAVEVFKKTLKPGEKVVLVTHGPAYHTGIDYLGWAGFVGCRSQRKFLNEIKPVLHISGHLHEHMYEVHEYKKTILVNAGAAGTVIELP